MSKYVIRESMLQKKCIKYCKKRNIFVMNMHGGGIFNQGGRADLLIIHKGTLIACELKKNDKEKVKPLQIDFLNDIIEAGSIACRIDDIDHFINLITLIEQGEQQELIQDKFKIPERVNQGIGIKRDRRKL